MSLNFDFTHNINGIPVAFHGSVTTPDEALTTIGAIIGANAAPTTAEQKQSTTGKDKAQAKNTSAASAAPSTDAQTQTASDSSANSSNATPAADAGTAGKPEGESIVQYEYDKHVKPLVLAISKKSRDLATALLQRHGAIDKASGQPSAKVLTPDQYPQFVKDAQDVLDGKLDPTQSTDGDMA